MTSGTHRATGRSVPGMSWTDRHADRVMTLDQAAGLVRDGDRVMGGLPEPAPFLQALAARRDVRDVAV